MTVDPNVRVPPTTKGPTNPANHVNPIDPAIPPRQEPPIGSLTEKQISVEQPADDTNENVPRVYAGETRPGVGQLAIGKPC
uniref:Uncharacterized protein n=1 Tax=Cannabis sativa TaxID=3483 RepID=A0A803QBN0_CANSA